MDIKSGLLVLRSLIVACLAVLAVPFSVAGQISEHWTPFSHLTTDDGLSASRVRTFFQDKKGFIWIGTESGLNRYDGRRFVVYKHQPAIAGSMINQSVPAILEDSRGNFWIGSKNGLQLMDRDKNRFFPGRDQRPFILPEIGSVLVLYEDSYHNIWVGTTNGLFRLSWRTTRPFSADAFEEAVKNKDLLTTPFYFDIKDSGSLSNGRVQCIGEDKEGYLWVGTGRGLNRFNLKTNTLERWPAGEDAETAVLKTLAINAVLPDRSGYCWVGTGSGLFRLSPDRKSVAAFRADNKHPGGLSDNFITKLLEDSRGNLWIGSDGGGLDLWNPATGTFIHHRYDPSDPESLSDNNIEALYEDRNGGLWVGNHKGICYLNYHRKPFQYYHNTMAHTSLSQGMVTCFSERPDGNVWIGIDDNGLDLFDRNANSFIHFKHETGNRQSICDDDVVTVLEDRHGMVWVGTWGGGLSRFVPKVSGGVPGGLFAHYVSDGKPGSISDNDIWTVFEDRSGQIWIGTVVGGLNQYNPETNTFTVFKHRENEPASLLRDWVMDICEDNKGRLWVATTAGISCLVPESGTFLNYPVNGPQGPMTVYAIHPDQTGRFWLGARNGLILFDPAKKTFRAWQEQDGLADNFITSILEDSRGNLWLSTGKGISRFNPQSGSFRNYDTHDGLQSGEFSGAHIKTHSGEFFFGGVSGFNVFHPDSIHDNRNVPPVVITDFKLFNQSVPVQGSVDDTSAAESPLLQQIFNTETIRLAYWQNDIAFEFAALNYLSPEKNKYRYRLEGDEQDWSEVESGQNVANYTNLSPGVYMFRVTGANNDGIWNEEGASVKIIISTPWWCTWWAYLLYALFTGALFYFLRRYELRRQQLKHDLELERVSAEQLKELDKTKSRLYTNITHEFRTPLTVILGMAGQMEQEVVDLQAGKWQKTPTAGLDILMYKLALIRRNGNHLLSLVNQMLDLTKLESNRMEVHIVQADIVAYIKYITESFHSMAEAKDQRLRVTADPESIFMDFDPAKLMQLVSNLLSNAIKFTLPGGVIDLSMTVDDFPQTEKDVPGNAQSFFVCKVTDTGIGIQPDQLAHVFDRFYQADNSSTRKGEGAGIGLALAKELVKLFDGEISVKSTPGQGTAFTVRLPVRKEAQVGGKDALDPTQLPLLPVSPVTRPGHQIESRSPGEESQPLLLLIEDNPDVMTYLIACLDEQYRIETAINGQQGIDKALEIIPDVIITDVMMPEKDGFEVCDTLKKDVRTSHIPIIILTARVTVEDRIAGLERGADAYIAKPFHPGELAAQIQNLIDLRRSLQERYRSLEAPAAQAGADEKVEDAFLLNFRSIVEGDISNTDLTIEVLCRRVGMSRMQLHRKIKALTDRSTTLYIRSIRLQRARHLLATTDQNVSEIAYTVGFDDPKYFSRVFVEEFGLTPSEVRKE